VADVTIPADVAKALAMWLRRESRESGQALTLNLQPIDEVADLLDPKPPRPELWEAVRVAAMLADNDPGWRAVDAVLAVVRERIEAIPANGGFRDYNEGRDSFKHDVLALFDGGAS
jgi:hypothetical protein